MDGAAAFDTAAERYETDAGRLRAMEGGAMEGAAAFDPAAERRDGDATRRRLGGRPRATGGG